MRKESYSIYCFPSRVRGRCLDLDTLESYLMGHLDPVTVSTVEAHLRRCPACRLERDSTAEFLGTMREALRRVNADAVELAD